MGQKTKISWTDATWNPIRGCSMAKGSEKGGCLNCYAARMASRKLPELRSPTTGENFAIIRDSGPRWTGKVELIESMLEKPLRWRKPRKIFVSSMSDLFHEALPDEAIDRVFAVMALCPQHTFQVLTKRPERMREYFRDKGIIGGNPSNNVYGRWLIAVNILRGHIGRGHDIPISNPGRFPLRHVWFGVSVENQANADARIPMLLQTPAAVRFVSYEPALGPVDLYKYLPTLEIERESGMWRDLIRWVIVGGESGPGARPFDVDWARNTVRQCKDAGVKCHVKQLGAHPIWSRDEAHLRLRDRKGGDMSEWPADLRVREFPQ